MRGHPADTFYYGLPSLYLCAMSQADRTALTCNEAAATYPEPAATCNEHAVGLSGAGRGVIRHLYNPPLRPRVRCDHLSCSRVPPCLCPLHLPPPRPRGDILPSPRWRRAGLTWRHSGGRRTVAPAARGPRASTLTAAPWTTLRSWSCCEQPRCVCCLWVALYNQTKAASPH